MKKKLLITLIAAFLVAAVIFVAAPATKAEATGADYTINENGNIVDRNSNEIDGNVITENGTLDLQGQDVTVNVADGVTLSVIDSANKGTTGENAGSLTNTGAGSVVAYEGNYQGIRFLKVVTNTETDDNDKIISKTYAFHPCFVRIDMIGVNTSKSALCLKVTYMTNKAAQGYISETGIMYGADPENLTSAADTFGAFKFEDTVMTAYFDLIGSLDNETAIGESRVFKAYFKSDDQVVANLPIEISPANVLKDLDDKADTFEQPQKDKMVAMLTGKAHLEKLCPNFLGKTEDAVTVAIGTFANGTVTADKESYKIGDTVTLTVDPEDGYFQKLYINGEPLMLGWKTFVYTFEATKNVYEITGSFATGLSLKPGDWGRWDDHNQLHGVLNTYYPSNGDSWWMDINGEYKSMEITAKNYLPIEASEDHGSAKAGYQQIIRFGLSNGKTYAFRIYNDKGTYAVSCTEVSKSSSGWGNWKNVAGVLGYSIDEAMAGDGVQFKVERTSADTMTISVNGVTMFTYTMDGVTEADKVTFVGTQSNFNSGKYVEIPFELK